MSKKLYTLLIYILSYITAQAQNLTDSLTYHLDIQTSNASGITPLWLNANKHGLSSLRTDNSYVRVALERTSASDPNRKWELGYGIDLVKAQHFTSDFILQQAYIEGRWLKGTLTIGSKEYPMELKNQRLSSGSQTFGINARPIPQVRIALPEYWTLPFAKGWFQIKGSVSFGWLTDNSWQRDFTDCKSNYTQNTLMHTKAGYMRIGKDNRPLSVELGLEMAVNFGGTSYKRNPDGSMISFKNGSGIDSYWKAFIPGGSDVNETDYRNVMGNQLGSWVMRINYDTKNWTARLYGEKFFEDHSSMFMLDYDGYGSGDQWDERVKSRYYVYDLKDMMVGLELNLKHFKPVRNIVFEYLYTKYQSGPLYHDHTPSISDHVSGLDDFYNHSLFSGWQHWGQVIGNPLYRSPIYNTDGTIKVQDNRFVAWHAGIDGTILSGLDYRVLASIQQGLGTYSMPYVRPQYNRSYLLEVNYQPPFKGFKGWSITAAYGWDRGAILGNNRGVQFTISKRGTL